MTAFSESGSLYLRVSVSSVSISLSLSPPPPPPPPYPHLPTHLTASFFLRDQKKKKILHCIYIFISFQLFHEAVSQTTILKRNLSVNSGDADGTNDGTDYLSSLPDTRFLASNSTLMSSPPITGFSSNNTPIEPPEPSFRGHQKETSEYRTKKLTRTKKSFSDALLFSIDCPSLPKVSSVQARIGRRSMVTSTGRRGRKNTQFEMGGN